ncbi:MAG: diguanylate cyclase domain-containing protein [Pleurocapsa sp.]
MVHPGKLDIIRHYLEPYYPGYIAVIDIAALKFRNDLLGHLVVDREIEELEEIINQYIDRREFSIRVGGDEWLLFFPNNPEKQLQSITNQYSKKQIKLIVGWQCEAKDKSATIKKAQEIRNSILYRGLKICYMPIKNNSEIKTKSEIIFDNVNYQLGYDVVNYPISAIDLIEVHKNKTWQSVNLNLSKIYCPFCHHQEFNWKDGDTSLFGAYGNCNQCDAEVSFSNFCQLAE